MNQLCRRILAAALALGLWLLPLAGCQNPAAPAAESQSAENYTLNNLPEYSGAPYVALQQNKPTFTAEQQKATAFEQYSELDALGRCGPAFACVGKELMPTKERGAIGAVKPSGWQIAKYDFVDGKYLYNRCHLIGYQLTGENANVKNLITGTRALNVEGMLPFENTVADYVKSTGNHVLYRVTPIFRGANLVASGVTIEALSVEDGGTGVCFYVYCYNAQPGVEINYQNGTSRAAVVIDAQSRPQKSNNGSGQSSGLAGGQSNSLASGQSESSATVQSSAQNLVGSLVVNTSTKKIHRPSCSAIKDMKPQNKKTVTKTCAQLEAEGYAPCRLCRPDKAE